MSSSTNPNNRWPYYGWIGIGLVAVAWPLNWSLPGLRTYILFFPLWLGYCLIVDAVSFWRTGTSMIKRNKKEYVKLYFISALVWWLFELINCRTQNWIYEGRQYFTDLQYFLFASFSFSTVMPAVFGTAEVVAIFIPKKQKQYNNNRYAQPTILWGFLGIGLTMLCLFLFWPRYFFPLVWTSLFLIIEPINFWLGTRTLFISTAQGRWRPISALAIGCLLCGFFWEMWNFYSYPKWTYSVPFVDFLRIFEMPLLGYGGYLFFSVELYVLYFFTSRVFAAKDDKKLLLLTL